MFKFSRTVTITYTMLLAAPEPSTTQEGNTLVTSRASVSLFSLCFGCCIPSKEYIYVYQSTMP